MKRVKGGWRWGGWKVGGRGWIGVGCCDLYVGHGTRGVESGWRWAMWKTLVGEANGLKQRVSWGGATV